MMRGIIRIKVNDTIAHLGMYENSYIVQYGNVMKTMVFVVVWHTR